MIPTIFSTGDLAEGMRKEPGKQEQVIGHRFLHTIHCASSWSESESKKAETIWADKNSPQQSRYRSMNISWGEGNTVIPTIFSTGDLAEGMQKEPGNKSR